MFQVKSILNFLVLIFKRSIMREINKKPNFFNKAAMKLVLDFGFISGLLVVQSEPESE